jgi:hypothetical protein
VLRGAQRPAHRLIPSDKLCRKWVKGASDGLSVRLIQCYTLTRKNGLQAPSVPSALLRQENDTGRVFGMSDRLALDTPSFELLLTAAWVLQCQHDDEISHCRDAAIAVADRSENDDLLNTVPLSSLYNCVDEQKAVNRADEPAVLSKWQIRVLVPGQSKRALRTAASAGPILILVIIGAFLVSEVWSREPANPVTEAAAKSSQTTAGDLSRDLLKADKTGQPKTQAVSDNTQTDPPALEASHRRVTDKATGSIVGALSPYEIKALQRQAEYGDDAAALTLGMAYETGRHVPQSCAQAANWVRIAAEGGNAAAQYNLALRYLYGDGVPASPEETDKWLQHAAARGYPKAESALQAQRLQSEPGQ